MTYVISESWNVSLGIEVMRRCVRSLLGFNEADWLIEPIATLEFVLPAAGSARTGTPELFGRPAIDLQMAYEQNWSNLRPSTTAPGIVGAALKLGWRF